MKVAIPYENNQIFQHFGKSKQVIIYTIENNKVVEKEVIDLDLKPEQSIANFVKNLGVSTLIVGHLGQGAIDSITNEGLTLIRGINQPFEDTIQQFIDGTLQSSTDEVCNHDHEGHDHHHHH